MSWQDRLKVDRPIGDRQQRAIVFLGTKDEWRGTGFVVHVTHRDLAFHYLVTSEHNVRDAAGEKDLVVRYRTETGTAETPFHEAPMHASWLFGTEHADGADVAAAIFFAAGCSSHCIPFDDILGVEALERWSVQPGDPTRTIGLYPRFPGTDQLTALVRTGIVAAMPDEAHEAKRDGMSYQFHPYLVETRSIPAMSGSPVFLVIEADVDQDGIPDDMVWRRAYLLGVNHGGWKLKAQTTDELVQWSEGISIAVPSAYLVQLLNSRAASDQRDSFVDAWEAGQTLDK